ncbi:hypothetical protein ACFY2Q_25430 [Micromonospora sp. NPDC000316]|uniref:hypothetical protein n=1 Tax=Micromonospora sp. NPDC000316 TaxID=3364216 RepID=UPI00369A09A7
MESEPEPPGGAAPRQRWSVGARLLLAATAVVLVLGAAAVVVIIADPNHLGMTYSGRNDGSRDGSHRDGSQHDRTRPDDSRPGGSGRDAGGPGGEGAAAVAEQTVTAPVAGRTEATFVLADGLASFDLRVADLGDDLYRISSPAGSSVAVRPMVQGGTVRLGLVASGASGERVARVLLNERVAWRLHLAGGVSEQVLDLGRARLLGVELAGGSARSELILPPVRGGTMSVRLTGGTSQLDVRVPGGPPVRVRVGAGAGTVAVFDDRWAGVAAGELLSTPGWDRAAERLFLDLVAGANLVTVTAAQ